MASDAPASVQRVLVCDDERHIVRLVQVNLQRQGYTVACAYDGRQAIGWLQREAFDLAIIDRDLPDMSGPQVIAWIRANEKTQTMPVMLMRKDGSADDDPPYDSLTRPFNFADFIRR